MISSFRKLETLVRDAVIVTEIMGKWQWDVLSFHYTCSELLKSHFWLTRRLACHFTIYGPISSNIIFCWPLSFTICNPFTVILTIEDCSQPYCYHSHYHSQSTTLHCHFHYHILYRIPSLSLTIYNPSLSFSLSLTIQNSFTITHYSEFPHYHSLSTILHYYSHYHLLSRTDLSQFSRSKIWNKEKTGSMTSLLRNENKKRDVTHEKKTGSVTSLIKRKRKAWRHFQKENKKFNGKKTRHVTSRTKRKRKYDRRPLISFYARV